MKSKESKDGISRGYGIAAARHWIGGYRECERLLELRGSVLDVFHGNGSGCVFTTHPEIFIE